MTDALLDPETLRRLEQLTLVSRKISAGRQKGERRSRKRGASTDFADYRNYVPGDDLRHLDWKVYGRLERLFLKLFLEEEDLRVSILLDASPSMAHGEPSKLLYAKRVAAAIGHICLARMDSLVVKAFGDKLSHSFGPKRGKVNSAAYFSFLSAIEPGEGTTTQLLPSFRSFAWTSRRRGMVIVISDFYDFAGYEAAFRQLFGGDFEVLVIHVLSPEELKPSLQGDIRLVDCEVGVSTDISMGASIMDLYDRTLTAFCNGIKDHVVGRGGAYLLASTGNPFDRLVLDVLRRRGIIQ